jgi:hypothetical protein
MGRPCVSQPGTNLALRPCKPSPSPGAGRQQLSWEGIEGPGRNHTLAAGSAGGRQAAAARLAQRQQQHRRQRKAGGHLQQLESVDDVFEDLIEGMTNVQVSIGVGRAVVQSEGGLQEKVEGRSGPELRRQGVQPLAAAVAKGGRQCRCVPSMVLVGQAG